MFSNMGRKIQTVGQIQVFCGILFCFFYGIYLMVVSEGFLGFLMIVGGSLLSWVSSFLIIGIGQLVENSEKIYRLMAKEAGVLEEEKEEIWDYDEKVISEPVRVMAKPKLSYLELYCPNCGEALSFDPETTSAVCPFCDIPLEIGK